MNSNQRLIIFAVIVAFSTLLLRSDLSANDNWPRFRGENGSGVSSSNNVPTDLSTYSWQIDLLGSGSSSPVVWGDKLIVTSCDPKSASLHVQCLNVADGSEKWKTSFESTTYRLHTRNSFAASTPAVDRNHVYIAYANTKQTLLVALDHAGEEVWRRDFGPWVSMHGFGMSPIVYKGKVILANSQQGVRLRGGASPGQSRVLAVDCSDGKTVWESKLETTYACYSVPCIFSSAGADQLIGCSNAEGFYSLNPDSGKKNWSQAAFKMRTVASPVIAGDLLLGSNGSGGGGNYLVALKMKNKAMRDKPPKEIYRINRSANYVPTPVVVNGMAFLFGDKGIATCIDVESGSEHWRERVASGFSGSPVATADNVYIIDESGNALVLAASKDYALIHTQSLGETSRSTPAIAAARIFLRTESKVFCVESSRN